MDLIQWNIRWKLNVKNLKLKEIKKLNKVFLIFTGNQRRAHDVASSYVRIAIQKKEMFEILGFVEKAKYLLNDKLDDFGNLLNESWQKKNLAKDFIRFLMKFSC